MHARPRRAVATLRREEVPPDPGVYAWYRRGDAIYVGKARSLRERVWGKHLGHGRAMTGSAFRRNVAQHLGIAAANEIYSGDYRCTDEDVLEVWAFIKGCHVAWITTATADEAGDLERGMKREWMPPLTRL